MVAQSTTQGGTPRQSATGKQRHRINTWQLDTAHTSVSFTAKHMMITKVRGAFNGVTGTIQFDEADPTASSVAVEFPAASIDRKGDRFAITGDLTIHGVTRPVVLDTEHLGIVTALDGRRHAGFEATTKIKRSDWGLTWNVGLETGGWLVSDEIAIELEVAAAELAAVPADRPLASASA